MLRTNGPAYFASTVAEQKVFYKIDTKMAQNGIDLAMASQGTG